MLVVLSGPSAVGKDTVLREMRERGVPMYYAITATTREIRPGEVDGRDYHFLSAEEFEARVESGDFVEHATYAGNRYGTLRSEVERPTRGTVLEIDLQGARQVRDALPGATQVFIAPPSLDDLRHRLEGRGADSPEQIRERLAVAPEELAARAEFEHVIVNDDLERAIGDLAELAGTMCRP